MSFLIRWLCAITAVLAAVVAAANASAMAAFDPAVTTLTTGNFTRATETGMWLVEFYSPYCPHCRNFAPTWSQLAEADSHLQDSSDFHIARVNCIAQGDLCERQNIDRYPSIELYREGTWFESYPGERTYEELDAYIQARAADNRRLIALAQRVS